MLKLLNRVIALEGVQVLIGSEIIHNSMDGMSFVASTYKDRSHPRGVIGPSMMNYEKVIPIVAHTANTLTNIFSEL
jgi:heat-inducible transcriptional repressor